MVRDLYGNVAWAHTMGKFWDDACTPMPGGSGDTCFSVVFSTTSGHSKHQRRMRIPGMLKHLRDGHIPVHIGKSTGKDSDVKGYNEANTDTESARNAVLPTRLNRSIQDN
ncbi:hypothetical protein CBL_06672 [Carabus blaptoides fortunei]